MADRMKDPSEAPPQTRVEGNFDSSRTTSWNKDSNQSEPSEKCFLPDQLLVPAICDPAISY